MNDVNAQFLLSLIVIAIGYGIKRAGWVHEDDGSGLSRLILYVTLPALILDTLPAIEIDPVLALMPFAAFGQGVLAVLVAYFAFKGEGEVRRGTLTMCAIGWNIGLFAYPLVEGIWGADGMKYIAMFDVGNAFVLFGLTYIAAAMLSPNDGEADARTIIKKLLTLPPLLAYLIGMAMNFAGASFPPGLADVWAFIGRANGPLVFLTLGVFLNFSLSREHWLGIGKVLAVRYGLGLAVGFGLRALVGGLGGLILQIALIMPVGMSVLPYAVQFGYDRKLTGAIVNLTIVVSFALAWLSISLFPI
jgi:hypothetical protein